MNNFNFLTELNEQLLTSAKYQKTDRSLTITAGIYLKGRNQNEPENGKVVSLDSWASLVRYLDSYSYHDRTKRGKGFVGGYGGVRDLVTIWSRDVSTITESVVMGDAEEAPYAEMAYIAEGSNLLRKDIVILVPLSRSVNSEEYTKVSQFIAYQNHLLGDGLCATASFEADGAVPWPMPKPVDGFLERLWKRTVGFDKLADVDWMLEQSVEWE